MKIHKTFNVSLFKKCSIDESRPQPPPPPVRVIKSGDAEYEIDKILKWRVSDTPGQHNVDFLTKWKGYSVDESTWEPLYHLSRYGGKKALQEYITETNNDELFKLVPAAFRPSTFTKALSTTTENGKKAKRRRKVKHWVP